MGAASAALGRGLQSIAFGAASTALCRSLLGVTLLAAASAGRWAAASHHAGARQESGDADPCKELLEFLCVHGSPPFLYHQFKANTIGTDEPNAILMIGKSYQDTMAMSRIRRNMGGCVLFSL